MGAMDVADFGVGADEALDAVGEAARRVAATGWTVADVEADPIRFIAETLLPVMVVYQAALT